MIEGTDMIENVARPNCRGSWALGTACGKCPRCEATRPTIAAMSVQAEPVAWMYESAFGREVCKFRWGSDEGLTSDHWLGWTETPLYAGPTPHAGGSDAE